MLLLLFALYFTFPANFMVYGVNDICDYDTDVLNPKKRDYESLVLPSERTTLLKVVAFSLAPFVPLLLFCATPLAIGSLAAFVFLSVYYSAPPIRAKARPAVDSLFNVLYAMPGFFGWAIAGGIGLKLLILIAAIAWTAAMHAFSAVPDIESDRQAGLRTISTALGERATVMLCLALYALSAAIGYVYLGTVAIALGTVYVAVMVITLLGSSKHRVMDIYRIFPAINTAAGAVIFATIFFSKHFKV